MQWQLQRVGDAALPQPSGRVVIWLDPSFLTFDVSSCQVRPPSCGALHMMLQGGGGAERLYIGFDFMGRARGRGRLQAGLGGRGGVGSLAALCFVAHIAASQQVRRRSCAQPCTPHKRAAPLAAVSRKFLCNGPYYSRGRRNRRDRVREGDSGSRVRVGRGHGRQVAPLSDLKLCPR